MPETTKQNEIREQAVVMLALTLVPGMGSRRIRQFLALVTGHGVDIHSLTAPGSVSLYRKIPDLAAQFEGVLEKLERELLEQAEACIRRAQQSGMEWTLILSDTYPAPFLDYLENGAPPFMFLSGARALLERPACAVVGTRSPSRKGIRAARGASELIVESGMVVVSGGASGVDWAAHDAAVAAGGATVIFLPQGISTYDLPTGWRDAMDSGRLLLASEYLPDAPWRTYAAVSRNALIAAQAGLVCVVEPRKQGGSILTARHAIAQGKQVFVEPVSALPVSLHPHAASLEQLGPALAEMNAGCVKAAGNRPRQSRLF